MNTVGKQQGFTLIELVIVIVILGILAATALPRFANVTQQAHDAAKNGAKGGLGAAVQLAHAQWVANGADTSGGVVVTGFGDGDIQVDANGWPVETTATDAGTAGTLEDSAECVGMWQSLMQNPPTVRDAADPDAGENYTALFGGTSCTYTYIPDGSGDTIVYNSATGAVTSTGF